MLLGAGVLWLVMGVLIILVTGGISGFLPSDPSVPTIGFSDAGDGRVAIEVGPESFAQAEGIEIRTGSEAQDGRLLWKIKRTGASSKDATGRVVVGEVPDGFAETDALEGSLPTLWHAEVDNRCYFGSDTVPKSVTADAVTLSSGERITSASFRSNDRGFSSCDTSTMAGRVAALAGLASVALGGVLLIAAWWDWRRGLPSLRAPGPDDAA
jgi:hypothetical protein